MARKIFVRKTSLPPLQLGASIGFRKAHPATCCENGTALDRVEPVPQKSHQNFIKSLCRSAFLSF
jgi:hypothetical protein